MMTTREGRSTCRYCRKPLNNGQELTTALVERGTVYRVTTANTFKAHYSDNLIPAAAHADCWTQNLINDAKSRICSLEELLAESPGHARTITQLHEAQQHLERLTNAGCGLMVEKCKEAE